MARVPHKMLIIADGWNKFSMGWGGRTGIIHKLNRAWPKMSHGWLIIADG